jgi:hypothetical protein
MIRETSIKIVKMTTGLATEFRDMASWKGERPLSDLRLAYLREALAQGTFDSPVWARATFKGKTVRMNGQHSAVMLAEATDIPKGLQAIIKDYDVDSTAELGELFMRFDHPLGSRHPREQLAALVASSNGVKQDVMKEREGLHRLASGIVFVQAEFVSKHATTMQRNACIQANLDFVDFGLGFTRHRYLRKPATLGAIFTTWSKARRDAHTFWSAVRDETGDPDTPARLLARTLRELTGAGSSLTVSREQYAKSISAWNAYREGASIQRLMYRVGNPMPQAE